MMLRQTANFIAELRALNRPPQSPDPRVYRRALETCGTCGKLPCLCPGLAAIRRRYAFHARRRAKCTSCGGPSPDKYLCQPCADIQNARGLDWRTKCAREGTLPALSGAGRIRPDDVPSMP